MPASASPDMKRGSAEKTVPEVWYFGLSGAGFSKLATRDVGALDERPDRAGVTGPLGRRDLPAERRAADATGDVGRPAIEREVRALALDREGLVDAAVEHDVAAREQGPGGRRVVGIGGGRRREAGRQRPVRDGLDALDAEQRLVAPGQRPDLGPDLVGAQEGEPLAVLA